MWLLIISLLMVFVHFSYRLSCLLFCKAILYIIKIIPLILNFVVSNTKIFARSFMAFYTFEFRNVLYTYIGKKISLYS